MLNIPAPPQPQLDALAVCMLAAGSVGVGAVLLLWGRILSRPFLAMIGVAVAVAAAGPLSQQFSVSPTVAGLVAAAVLALVAAITARLIWALAAGAVFGASAIIAMLVNMPAPAGGLLDFAPVDPGFGAWLTACWNAVGTALAAAWKDRSQTVLWAVCLGGGIPLTVALLLPKLGKIVMTSLLAVAAIIGGVFLVVTQIRSSLWPREWLGYGVPIVAAAVLLMFGIIYQFCAEVLADRAKKAEKTDKAKAGGKKEEKKSSDSAEKKKH